MSYRALPNDGIKLTVNSVTPFEKRSKVARLSQLKTMRKLIARMLAVAVLWITYGRP
jgi:hypothetical protein